jgi:uncharacterized protein YbjT (DUF2867 family)
MSKLLVIFGITGNQGGSIANFVLNDPQLSKEYKIRGLTRDPSKASSWQSKNVELVAADVQDPSSIKAALQGAHTVFSMTTSIYERRAGKQKEFAHGKLIADTAVAAGAKYLIWSSMVSPTKLSGGKLTKVDHFDSKYEVEQYIRTLPIKAAFFVPGSFMQNFHGMMGPRPSQSGGGTYAMTNVFNPDTQLPLIDVNGDTGKWVGAILAEPDAYAGKCLDCATRLYTVTEVADIMSKATGKKVTYNQVPDEVMIKFMPPHFDEEYLQMLQLMRDYGYYGENMKGNVEWAAKQARGKLTTLEEFFQKHPLKLED